MQQKRQERQNLKTLFLSVWILELLLAVTMLEQYLFYTEKYQLTSKTLHMCLVVLKLWYENSTNNL